MATAKKTTKKAASKSKAATARKSTKKAATPKATTTTTKSTSTSTQAPGKAEHGFRLHVGNIELGELDVRTAIADSAYATVGAGDRAVELARDLPERLETLRKQRETFVSDTRQKVESFVKDVPSKFQSELEEGVETARKEFDSYASRGRKVVDTISNNETAKKALDRTETARHQVNTAVTNLRGYVEQGQDRLEQAAERVGLRRSA